MSNAAGPLFRARMWREYAQCWDGSATPSGVNQAWVEVILRVSRTEYLRRAWAEVEAAHLINLSNSMPAVDPEELDDPYQTCEYGHHAWKITGHDDDGNPEYCCADCGSTDPEGDQAR